MLITNFASGELTKKLYGRADIQQYYQGASKLVNFNIVPTGGIDRRNGFRRCEEMQEEARLIPYIIDKNLSFILEVGPGYIALWKNGSRLMSAPDAQGNKHWIKFTTSEDIPLPSTLDQVREMQYVQNYNKVYFVQRDTPPFYIKYDGGSFSLHEMKFDFEPDIELIEEKGCEGVYKESEDEDLPEPDRTTFQSVNHYPGVIAFYQNRLWLGSTKTNPQKIWVSAAPNSKGDRYTTFDTYTHYVTVSRVVKDADLHVFSCSGNSGGMILSGVTQNLTGSLEEDATKYYVTGEGVAIGTKVTAIYPTYIEIDTPLIAKMENSTCTIQLWKNATAATSDDYEYDIQKNDMTNADNGFFFELASDQNDNIKWISPSQHLVIGTESSEYVVQSGSNALSIAVSLNGRHSSDDIQALYIGEAVIFFAQGKHAIREYYYNSETAAFQSNNITVMNPDILEESPAVDFDYMNNPYSRLLITKEDGTVAVLLYEKSSGILGWSRLEHGKGKIVSCATVRSDTSSDTLYAAVKYSDDSERGYKIYMEEINLTGNKYLDSYSTFTSGTEDNYTDDAVIWNGSTEVRLGDATNIQSLYGDNVIIGYKYESLITSMPVINSAVTGSKRITDLVIRLSDSYLPEIVNPNGVTEIITGITEPYSGVRKVIYPGNSNSDVFFTIKTEKPNRCTVLAVNANLA